MASRVGNVLLSSSDMAGIFNICLQPFMLTFLVVYIRTTCKVLVLSSSRSKSIWRFCQKSDLDHSRDRYWLSPGSFLIWTKADSEFETGRKGGLEWMVDLYEVGVPKADPLSHYTPLAESSPSRLASISEPRNAESCSLMCTSTTIYKVVGGWHFIG